MLIVVEKGHEKLCKTLVTQQEESKTPVEEHSRYHSEYHEDKWNQLYQMTILFF